MVKTIIIADEHHGKVYIDASTPEQFDKACLSILRNRHASYMKGWMEEVEKRETPKPSLSFDVAQALPDGKVKDMALSEWSEYHREMKIQKDEEFLVKNIRTALNTNNGKIAYKLLCARRNREDEGIEIVEVLDEFPQETQV